MDTEEQSIQPQTVYYSGLYPQDETSSGQGRLPTLAEVLVDHFKNGLGLPRLQNSDLAVLDEAISLLNPPIAQLRVVEERTFTESEMSIVRGEVPLYDGDYALSQKVILIHRRTPGSDWPPRVPPASIATQPSLPSTLFGQDLAPASGTSVVPEKTRTDDAKAAGSKEAAVEAGMGVRTGDERGDGDDNQPSDSVKLLEANVEFTPAVAPGVELVGAAAAGTMETVTAWRELPEIILLWARERRQGGNLIVCPNASMDRFVQAYMVCEVVEHSEKKIGGYLSDRQGMLMGVELGECLPAEQDALQNLLSNYSFQDATLGFVSLLLSEIYFGYFGKDDVNVLTLLAVGVVAGLNQEATWPWVFNLIIRCSRITDPMIRVTQCKRIHNHQGQQSGPGVLTIGLAAFGVYLEILYSGTEPTSIGFRIALGLFQGTFLVFIVVNMVQAVVPIVVTDDRPLTDLLKPWARRLMNEKSVDSNWYLSVLVALIWAAVIAATVVSLDYAGSKRDITVDVFCTVVVILVISLVTTNPGAVVVAVWGLLWLVPAGFAFATRSVFDIMDRVIHRLNLYLRRMARESLSHLHASDRAEGVVNLKTVVLIFQVLPLIPLFILFLPMPFLYALIWAIHISLRALLLVSDLIIAPVSSFKLYPLLSDYGSVTWKMALLDMSVERSSMRTMLKRRISKLMEDGKLGDMMRKGVIPPSPYSYLGQGPPRLGCVALVTEESGARVLKADRDSSRRLASGAGDV